MSISEQQQRVLDILKDGREMGRKDFFLAAVRMTTVRSLMKKKLVELCPNGQNGISGIQAVRIVKR